MDYEYYYNNAKSSYYDACVGINSCKANINDLTNQKKYKIKEINEKNARISDLKHAVDHIDDCLKKEDDLNSKIKDIGSKTDQVSMNYKRMIVCDSIVSKNISDVYNEEYTSTKMKMETIFSTLKAKKENLIAEIERLQSEISVARSELQIINNCIRQNNSELYFWTNKRRNSSNNMEYYRRKSESW